jgi:hypothetical protein
MAKPHDPVIEEVVCFLSDSRGRGPLVFVPAAREGVHAALMIAALHGELDEASADCLKFARYLDSQGARTAAQTLRTAVQAARDATRSRHVGKELRRREVIEKTAQRFMEFSETGGEVAHTAAQVGARRPKGSLRKADLQGALACPLRG